MFYFHALCRLFLLLKLLLLLFFPQLLLLLLCTAIVHGEFCWLWVHLICPETLVATKVCCAARHWHRQSQPRSMHLILYTLAKSFPLRNAHWIYMLVCVCFQCVCAASCVCLSATCLLMKWTAARWIKCWQKANCQSSRRMSNYNWRTAENSVRSLWVRLSVCVRQQWCPIMVRVRAQWTSNWRYFECVCAAWLALPQSM